MIQEIGWDMRSNTYACTLALIGTLIVVLTIGISHFVLGIPVWQGCTLVLGLMFLLTAVSQIFLFLAGETYRVQGDNRLSRDDYEGAIASYTRLVRRKPQSSDGYYYRGLAYYYAGDLNSASADLDQALHLSSHNLEKASQWVSPSRGLPGACAFHFACGLVRLASGDVDIAAQDFEAAHNLASPYDDKALLGLVAVRHAQGRVEEAISLWQELVARNKRYGDLELMQRVFRRDHPRADLLVEEVRGLVARS